MRLTTIANTGCLMKRSVNDVRGVSCGMEFGLGSCRLAVLFCDCDEDTVLLKVTRLGDGNVCHTGERTCFFRKAD